MFKDVAKSVPFSGGFKDVLVFGPDLWIWKLEWKVEVHCFVLLLEKEVFYLDLNWSCVALSFDLMWKWK